MKVKQTEVVKLLKELDMSTADRWPLDRIEKKLQTLPKLVKEEELKAKTADGQKLLKLILTAVKNKEEIAITTGAPASKPAAKPAAKPTPKEEEIEEEVLEDEAETEEEAVTEEPTEDEEVAEEEEAVEEEAETESEEVAEEAAEEKKPSSKKGKAPPKSAGGDGKPGIIASIVERLEKSSAEKPVSKKGILEFLKKRFPDRNADSMSRTVAVQVPNRLKHDKGIILAKNDKGQYHIAERKKVKE